MFVDVIRVHYHSGMCKELVRQSAQILGGVCRRILAAMLPRMVDYLGGGRFVQSIEYGCTRAGGVRTRLQWPTDAEAEAERLAAVVQALNRNVATAVQSGVR